MYADRCVNTFKYVVKKEKKRKRKEKRKKVVRQKFVDVQTHKCVERDAVLQGVAHEARDVRVNQEF